MEKKGFVALLKADGSIKEVWGDVSKEELRPFVTEALKRRSKAWFEKFKGKPWRFEVLTFKDKPFLILYGEELNEEELLIDIFRLGLNSASEEDFFSKLCPLLKTRKNCVAVWAARAKPVEGKLELLAEQGGFFKELEEGLLPEETPLRAAFRFGQRVIADVDDENMPLTWRERAKRLRVKSCLYLPIFSGSEDFHIVALYFSEITDYKEEAFFRELKLIIKNTLERLRQDEERREEKFKDLLYFFSERSIAGFFLIEGTKIKFVNQRLCEMLGYSKEEMLGRNFLRFVHPDYRKPIKEIARNPSQLRQSKRQPLVLVHKNGSLVYTEALYSVLKEGSSYSIVGTLINITRRQQLEQLLRKQLSYQTAIAELARDALRVKEEKRMMQRAEELTCAQLGASLLQVFKIDEELEVVSDRGWKLGKEVLQELEPILKDVVEKKEPLFYENLSLAPLALKKAYGKRFRSLLLFPVFFDRHPRVLAYLFEKPAAFGKSEEEFIRTVADILLVYLERRKALKKIEESERRLRTVFEKVTHGLYLVEVEGEGKFRYVLSNKVLDDIGGVKFEGKTVEEALPPEQAAQTKEAFKIVVKTRGPVISEHPFELLSGKKNLVVERFPVMNRKGRVTAIVGVVRDLSKETELREKMRILDKKLRVANKFEDLKFYLREKLSVVQGAADIIVMELKDIGIEAEDVLGYWKENIRKATKDLVSALEWISSPLPPEKQIFDLGVELEKNKKHLIKIASPGVEFKFNFEKGLYVRAHYLSLFFAISELVRNAARALGGKGKIRIRVYKQYLEKLGEGKKPGDYAVVEVYDSGPGIPEYARSRVFDPFFTLNEERMGLGLTWVKEIIEAQGGYVDLDSSEGKGTVFKLYLPLLEEKERGEEREEEIEAPAVPRKIMVVDDKPDVLNLLVKFIEKMGHIPVPALSKEEALAKFEDNPDVELLIADIVLKNNENGVELARELHRKKPDMGIILITGFDEMGFESARDLPVFAKFVKPISFKEMARVIADYFKKKEVVN